MTACREATGQEIVPSPVTNGRPSATMTRPRSGCMHVGDPTAPAPRRGRPHALVEGASRFVGGAVLMTAVVVGPVATAADAADSS